MTIITTRWHCYGCKQLHTRKFAEKDVRNFMIADCPYCRKRREMVRVRRRPFSGGSNVPCTC